MHLYYKDQDGFLTEINVDRLVKYTIYYLKDAGGFWQCNIKSCMHHALCDLIRNRIPQAIWN